MNIYKSHLKKEDKVKILSGKDKGKIGRVLKVDRKKNRVLVEHVNMMKKHTRPSAKNRQGGIVEAEAAMHISNVMLMCSKCMKPVRLKMQELEDGQKKRVCRKCNETIDA
jgi:large subunit ribosomal protein L24